TLNLRNARPILHIEVLVRFLDGAVFGWQGGNGPFEIADGRQVLIQTPLVFFWKALAKFGRIFLHSVQNAALAIYPAFVLRAEQTVEKPVRNLLRGERTIRTGPAHVFLYGTAKALLRNTHLERPEAHVFCHTPRQNLVD